MKILYVASMQYKQMAEQTLVQAIIMYVKTNEDLMYQKFLNYILSNSIHTWLLPHM